MLSLVLELLGFADELPRLLPLYPLGYLVYAAPAAAVVFLMLRRRATRRQLDGAGAEQAMEEAEPAQLGQVLREYYVEAHGSSILIRLVEEGGAIKYEVEEPKVSRSVEAALGAARREYVEKGKGIEALLERHSRGLSDEDSSALEYYLRRDLRGYGKLDVFFRDPEIEDFTITSPGPVRLIHRSAPQLGWIESSVVVGEEELDALVRLAVERSGGDITPARPYAEVLTRSYDRVAASLGGEIGRHSTITVRKFPRKPYMLHELVYRFGSMPVQVAAYLALAVELRMNVLIVGLTGSGKTTLLNALLLELPREMKVLTIEEVPEINLEGHPGWQALYARTPGSPGAAGVAVPLSALVKLALRHRPSVIAVGEARGEEVQDMVTAASIGHGTVTTIHSDSIERAISRLTSHPMNLRREQLGLIDIVAVMRSRGAGRYLEEVYENRGGRFELIYTWRSRSVPSLHAESVRLTEVAIEEGIDAAKELERRAVSIAREGARLG